MHKNYNDDSKLPNHQFVAYDKDGMVYKLGQPMHLRARRLRRQIGISLFFGCAVISLGVYAKVHSNPFKPVAVVVQHPHSGAYKQAIVQSSNKSGSAKQPPKGTANSMVAQPTATIRSSGCQLFSSAHSGLSAAQAPQLRKLAQYEQLCSGALAARSSFFVPTPSTLGEAQSCARDAAAILKDYARYGVAPLVFMEPTSPSGANLDLAGYASGAYDTVLDSYYAALKTNGITDSMMGMWVYLPEGNLPEWSSVDPNIFAAVVTKTATLQKKYFPASQASIMLDSETYASTDSWGNGAFVSLLPYVQNIPKGLLDSFGLQGFPWTAPANQPANTFYDPRAYLRTDFAAQAARVLGITNIWVNTGTFNQMYAGKPGRTVTLTPAERQAMLNGVLQEMVQLKGQGFTVAIHVFAENKANTAEGTDWSYWQAWPTNDAGATVFATFAHDAAASGVPLWLFDTEH